MRAMLFDWLVEIHCGFRLRTETLYLAFDIVDRYISVVSVTRRRFQLLGATALVIASKYEEMEHPELAKVAFLTHGACNRTDILDMETAVLSALDYRISNPTSYPFLRRFLFLVGAPRTTRLAAYYYLERSAQDYTLVNERPSRVAAAAVSLAINHPDVRERDRLDRTPPGVVSKQIRLFRRRRQRFVCGFVRRSHPTAVCVATSQRFCCSTRSSRGTASLSWLLAWPSRLDPPRHRS
jgi:hypothetical protein